MVCGGGGAAAGRTGHAAHGSDLPAGPENLVVAAVGAAAFVRACDAGATVRLVKRIPAAAGLGGASSDAAAALVAANRLWRLGWTRGHVWRRSRPRWAATCRSSCAAERPICRGRGERMEPLGGLPHLHVVVVRPPGGTVHAEVYRRLPAGGRAAAEWNGCWTPCGPGTRPTSGGTCSIGCSRRPSVCRRGSRELRAAFSRLDCCGHQMSGSGTSYFGVCRHARHARRVAGQLRAAGWGAVFPATTCSGGRSPRWKANRFKEERHGDHRGSHQAHGRCG